jgi:hypothetical protein
LALTKPCDPTLPPGNNDDGWIHSRIMNQPSATFGKTAPRTPVFFWITISLLALVFLGGAAGALLLVFEAKSINRSGGWGWLLVGAIYLVAIIVVCFACAICTAVSLFRGESHRRLSIVILVISGFVTLVVGANFVRGTVVRYLRHDEVVRRSASTPRPPDTGPSRSSIPPSANRSSNASVTREVENQQIQELKSRLWEAIRAKDADAFVDCFFIEERFNTPEIRQENRKQVEALLKGEIVDVEILQIPDKEVIEIIKIQHAKPASQVRYSLMPMKMLRIRQEALNGSVGRSFLIGERNGRWHIVTLAGHTT